MKTIQHHNAQRFRDFPSALPQARATSRNVRNVYGTLFCSRFPFLLLPQFPFTLLFHSSSHAPSPYFPLVLLIFVSIRLHFLLLFTFLRLIRVFASSYPLSVSYPSPHSFSSPSLSGTSWLHTAVKPVASTLAQVLLQMPRFSTEGRCMGKRRCSSTCSCHGGE